MPIGDEMEERLIEAGASGFNIMFPWLPNGLDEFVGKVVPELRRRGIFRREYQVRLLREHLGRPRQSNRFFVESAASEISPASL